MKNDKIFIFALLFLLTGMTCVGWGIGYLFNRSYEGTTIGVGIGALMAAIKLIKLFRIKEQERTGKPIDL